MKHVLVFINQLFITSQSAFNEALHQYCMLRNNCKTHLYIHLKKRYVIFHICRHICSDISTHNTRLGNRLPWWTPASWTWKNIFRTWKNIFRARMFLSRYELCYNQLPKTCSSRLCSTIIIIIHDKETPSCQFPIRFKSRTQWITLKLISSVVIEYYSISSNTVYPSFTAGVHLVTLLFISFNKISNFREKIRLDKMRNYIQVAILFSDKKARNEV